MRGADLGMALFFRGQLIDGLAKLVNAVEGLVHGNEADVGNFIGLAKKITHEIPDYLGAEFVFTGLVNPFGNFADNLVDLKGGYWAILACSLDSPSNLLWIKPLKRAVLLHNHDLGRLNAFVCRETILALEALAAAADSVVYFS